MGRKCNVLDCPSDSRRTEDNGVTFHKMPLHPDLRPKWIELCRIPEDRQLNKVIYVCSRHFRRTDFCNFKGTKYMLRQGALPSVFPWTRSLIKLPHLTLAELKALGTATTSESKESENEEVKSETKEDYSNINEDVNLTDEKPVVKEEKEMPKVSDEKTPKPKRNVEDKQKGKKQNEEKRKIKKESENKSSIKKEIEEKPKKEIDEKPPKIKKETTVIKSDIDIPLIPPKIKEEIPPINFSIGTRIEANDFNDTWYPGTIVEIDSVEKEVFVEFDKHLNRTNEWIPEDSSRLRSYVGVSSTDFVIGEKCMATWMNSCSKYPATIKKILDGDSYEVLFDDGFTKILKHCKLSKIKDQNNIPLPPKAPVPHAAPLFEPAVGSKKDRRDRKRKINVAALFSRKRSRLDDHLQFKIEEDEKYLEDEVPTSTVLQQSLPNAEGEEWTCRWLNGQPIGIEATLETPDGSRRSVIVADHRLPLGWEKHFTQRQYGHSAGKWDAILVNSDGKKFANRAQIKTWFEENKLNYNLENFDFSLHINRAKKLGLYEITDRDLKNANLNPPAIAKHTPGPKPKGAGKLHNVKSSVPKVHPTVPSTLPDASLTEAVAAEEDDNAGSLKIIHENDSYKCPIEGCGKNFRKENLAQMHIKHYHPKYSKLIGSTPNVADLAYARTVGEREHIDEIVLQKIKSTILPFEKDKLFKADVPSKPKSTIKVLTPKTFVKDEIKSSIPIQSVTSGINTPKAISKDSEIIRLLNSEPKTKMDSIFDSVHLHKQLTSEDSVNSSSKYPEIKLRDLLNKAEPIPFKKEEYHRSTGIKTLLPVNRNVDEPKMEPDIDMALKTPEKTKVNRKRPSSDSKKRQSFKYDTDEMSDYYEGESQDSFQIKSSIETPVVPPISDGHVIIEGGEVIRLVHMRSEEIINCTCGITEEDGLMIQCELCLCWQHAHCNNIARENEVPDKYICKICKNPQRMRQSKKYIHDQEWLKRGVLPTANYHSKDLKKLEQNFEVLRKSHELSACVNEMGEYLHNLKIKLSIAEAKDHPKLYLWAKPWEKTYPNNILNLQNPNSVKEEPNESINTLSSDHSYIKSTAFTDMALKTMLEPVDQLTDEINSNEMKIPTDTKINSQSELISILEDNEPSTSANNDLKSEMEASNSEFPKIDLNSIIENNLSDKIDSKDDVYMNKEEALSSITSGILSTCSLDLGLNQSDLDRLSALAQLTGVESSQEVTQQMHIPQPEAVIDLLDCKLNLLDHVMHGQNIIEERLDAVEAALCELEEEDSNPLPDDDEHDSKTKHTLQMLIRDLGLMRDLAAMNFEKT